MFSMFSLCEETHYMHFFLADVILTDTFIGYLVGNTLWLVAVGYYIYVTFLGYSGKFWWFKSVTGKSIDVSSGFTGTCQTAYDLHNFTSILTLEPAHCPQAEWHVTFVTTFNSFPSYRWKSLTIFFPGVDSGSMLLTMGSWLQTFSSVDDPGIC